MQNLETESTSTTEEKVEKGIPLSWEEFDNYKGKTATRFQEIDWDKPVFEKAENVQNVEGPIDLTELETGTLLLVDGDHPTASGWLFEYMRGKDGPYIITVSYTHLTLPTN